MTKPSKISYGIVGLTLALGAVLGLTTLLLATLFSYFALQKLSFSQNKIIALVLFSAIVFTAGYGSVYFFNQALSAFPKIAENAIPAIIRFAEQYQMELPFTDLESLKTVALETVMEEIRFLGKRAGIIGKQAVLLIVGFVVAVSLFLSRKWNFQEPAVAENLYSLVCAEVVERFTLLYQSFSTVMGAQLTISAINTALTAVFIFWVGLPYAGLVIAVTFFCGLLPIIGNLISNTVIVCVAFTITPKLGIAALIFLITLHKLEYFLNSQIIGTRIKNPMWLTLLALIVAERVMGIPGMILAPVLLNYLRLEASQIPLNRPQLPNLIVAEEGSAEAFVSTASQNK